jgi:hypothetical protein
MHGAFQIDSGMFIVSLAEKYLFVLSKSAPRQEAGFGAPRLRFEGVQ